MKWRKRKCAGDGVVHGSRLIAPGGVGVKGGVVAGW